LTDFKRGETKRAKKSAIASLILCLGIAAALPVSVRSNPGKNDEKANRGRGHQQQSKGNSQEPSPPVYNPYPHGILPADLESEIARVLREIDVIEARAIERWHSLPLPTLAILCL
jgi:hypothetical protein